MSEAIQQMLELHEVRQRLSYRCSCWRCQIAKSNVPHGTVVKASTTATTRRVTRVLKELQDDIQRLERDGGTREDLLELLASPKYVEALAAARYEAMKDGFDDGVLLGEQILGDDIDEDDEDLLGGLMEQAEMYSEDALEQVAAPIRVAGTGTAVPALAGIAMLGLGKLIDRAERWVDNERYGGQGQGLLFVYTVLGVEFGRWQSLEEACPICDGYHGRIWPIDVIMEHFPAHPNCRCHIEPVQTLRPDDVVEIEPPLNVFDDPSLRKFPWSPLQKSLVLKTKLKRFLAKANPYRDQAGRFTSADNATTISPGDKLRSLTYKPFTSEDRPNVTGIRPAFRWRDFVFSAPDSEALHAEVFLLMEDRLGQKRASDIVLAADADGFVTNDGQFLSRDDAARLFNGARHAQDFIRLRSSMQKRLTRIQQVKVAVAKKQARDRHEAALELDRQRRAEKEAESLAEQGLAVEKRRETEAAVASARAESSDRTLVLGLVGLKRKFMRMIGLNGRE